MNQIRAIDANHEFLDVARCALGKVRPLAFDDIRYPTFCEKVMTALNCIKKAQEEIEKHWPYLSK